MSTGLAVRLKALISFMCIARVKSLRMLFRVTDSSVVTHVLMSVCDLSLDAMANPVLLSIFFHFVNMLPMGEFFTFLMVKDKDNFFSTSHAGSAWIQQVTFTEHAGADSHERSDSIFFFVCAVAVAMAWLLGAIIASDHTLLCRAAYDQAMATLYKPHRPTLVLATGASISLTLYAICGRQVNFMTLPATDTEPVTVFWNEWPDVLIQALLVDSAINTAWLTLLVVGSVTRALGMFKMQINFVTTTFVSTYPNDLGPEHCVHWFAHTTHLCSPLPCVQAWFSHDPAYSSLIYNSIEEVPEASLELARSFLTALDWSVPTLSCVKNLTNDTPFCMMVGCCRRRII